MQFALPVALPVVTFPGPVTLAGILRAFSAEERNWLDFLIGETEELMNNPDDNDQSTINVRWVEEAESRLDAYNEGKLFSLPISKVFEELERMKTENS
jgi:hypothetical protein